MSIGHINKHNHKNANQSIEKPTQIIAIFIIIIIFCIYIILLYLGHHEFICLQLTYFNITIITIIITSSQL